MSASRSDDLTRRDREHVWHPFTPHSVWEQEDAPVIGSAEGCDLIDTDGNRYIDGVSSLWVNVHGHSHPKIVGAIKEQTEKLQHATFLGLTHPRAVELAERLVDLAPGELSRVFFSENGAAAVEVALKMAFGYWRNTGAERTRFVRLADAYHGDTLGAVSVGGIERFHETYRPLLFETAAVPNPYCYRCPLDKTYPECGIACAEALSDVLAREGDNVAAVVVEPLVQGAAGMITAPDGHLARIAEITKAHGTLLIVDEIATGFGRTGTMFACEHEGIEPDLLTLGKGITGGYLPLSATLATEEIFEAFLGSPEEHRTLYHGHSYSANPITCAAALANLDVFAEERTLEELGPKAELLERLLKPLADHPHVGEVRQRGFMVGIELVADRATKESYAEAAQMGARVAKAARPKGAIIRPLGDVVVLMPPLAIDEERLERLVAITHESIDEVTLVNPLAFTRDELDRLASDVLLREVHPLSTPQDPEVERDGHKLTLFASNNYLGLANDPRVVDAAAEAVKRWGAGAGSARLITGATTLHDELERALAELKGTESALLYSSGYLANLGTISALADRGDAIFSDELNHASIIDGARLSRADVHVYRHSDVEHLTELLASTPARRKLVVTDAVFSMDGDLAPLPDIADACERYEAILMVDEAHATGVIGPGGRGAVAHFGLEGHVHVIMGTLSKALGSAGGYIAGSADLISFLRNTARAFIFDTAMPAPVAAAAKRSIEILRDEPGLPSRVHSNAARLARGLGLPDPVAAIVPILVGGTEEALRLSDTLRSDGVLVPAIRPPTVAPGTSRLRATVMATHTNEQIDEFVNAYNRASISV